MAGSDLIAPLVVGSIAGLILTSNAFQRPQQLANKYYNVCRKNGIFLDKDEFDRKKVNVHDKRTRRFLERVSRGYLLDRTCLLGINYLEIFELTVIFVFLLLETVIFLGYFLFSFDQNVEAFCFLLLLFNLSVIVYTYLSGLFDASLLLRYKDDVRRISTPPSNVPPVDDSELLKVPVDAIIKK